MDAKDIDKIADKLMNFRGKIPKYEDWPLNWYQRECCEQLRNEIDRILEVLDLFGMCGVV